MIINGQVQEMNEEISQGENPVETQPIEKTESPHKTKEVFDSYYMNIYRKQGHVTIDPIKLNKQDIEKIKENILDNMICIEQENLHIAFTDVMGFTLNKKEEYNNPLVIPNKFNLFKRGKKKWM